MWTANAVYIDGWWGKWEAWGSRSLASVGQNKSESSPNLSLRLRVAQKSSLLYNYTAWKCARNFGWKVSERMYKLNLWVKWDTEGLVTALQLDSHSPQPLTPPHSAHIISSLVGLPDPFCNQLISHSWDCSLDTHLEVNDYKLQAPKGLSNLG